MNRCLFNTRWIFSQWVQCTEKKKKKVFPQLEFNLCPRHMIPLPLPLRDGTCLLVDERWWQTYGEQTSWPEPVQQSRLCSLTVQSGTVSGSVTRNPPPCPPLTPSPVLIQCQWMWRRVGGAEKNREAGRGDILAFWCARWLLCCSGFTAECSLFSPPLPFGWFPSPLLSNHF